MEGAFHSHLPPDHNDWSVYTSPHPSYFSLRNVGYILAIVATVSGLSIECRETDPA